MLWMVISTRARLFRGPTAVENPGKSCPGRSWDSLERLGKREKSHRCQDHVGANLDGSQVVSWKNIFTMNLNAVLAGLLKWLWQPLSS